MTPVFHPIGVFLFGIGGGFAIPLLHRLGATWLHAGFFVALAGLTLSSLAPLAAILTGSPPFEILTAGAEPPISINLRFGLQEGAIAASVNIVAMLLALALWNRLRGGYVPLLLFLVVVMGVNGMIMTRDLFNLFVFLEIVSIGTYGLLSLSGARTGIEGAFKYVLVTVVASTLFLLGAALLYQATGRLNIDLLLEGAAAPAGPVEFAALAMLLGCLMLELKPWPANGWALDVYETAPAPLAGFLSVVASAGMIFALWKLLPLFAGMTDLIVLSAATTYVVSNLAGLRQNDVQRLLGYSSIGQMALLTLALAALTRIGADEATSLIAFGFFVNHLLAKAGLFCLVEAANARRVSLGLSVRNRRLHLGLLTLFVVAISALPPFPGFWAKWELVMRLAAAGDHALIAAVLAGSLLEAAYLFRWLIRCFGDGDGAEPSATPNRERTAALVALSALLLVASAAGAVAAGVALLPSLLPIGAAAALAVFEAVPARARCVAMLAVVAAGTYAMPEAEGIADLFATLLLAGSLVIAAAGLHQSGAPAGRYPLMAALLLAVQALIRAETGLEFYLAWEFVTLACFFLILGGTGTGPEVLRFLVFSLLAAFLLLAGFAMLAAQTGSTDLDALRTAGPGTALALSLMAAGLLVKAAAVGVHVWLPAAYAEAPDEVTALLSAVVSKTAIFGLLLGGYAVSRSEAALDYGPALAWIGMVTTVAGALFALVQTDAKRLLAYSSMSQLGYIVTAVGLTSHLGWVTTLYLVASHMLVKGVLFLALAGVFLRCGARRLDRLGGLWRSMPVTAALAGLALLSMSGLPPFMGFGAKWLLLSAMAEKGWSALAALGAVATFLGLWYMIRLFAAVFLGPAAPEAPPTREAPALLLLPQAVLILGVFLLTLFPKLLMAPVSAAIDPAFAATLVWEGASLETIYDLWDPAPTMLAALAAAAAFAALLGLAARLGGVGSSLGRAIRAPLPRWIAPPLAMIAWSAAAEAAHRGADIVRGVYTGDGQAYVLLALGYFIALYVAASLPF